MRYAAAVHYGRRLTSALWDIIMISNSNNNKINSNNLKLLENDDIQGCARELVSPFHYTTTHGAARKARPKCDFSLMAYPRCRFKIFFTRPI